MKITDDDNNELPWGGKTFGRLKVRGPAVAKAYRKRKGGEMSVDEIPHTATGKIQKLILRQQFKDYVLPAVQAAE